MNILQTLEYFTSRFYVIRCSDQQHVDACYKIRHEIYCKEKAWESQKNELLEHDEFDKYSIHYLVVARSSSKPIGTFRMINKADKLPLLSHITPLHIFHPNNFSMNVCEISRFAILQNHRNINLVVALIMFASFETAHNRLIGAYMVMEKSLAKLINRCGIKNTKISNDFALNGDRAIYFCSVVDGLTPLYSIVGFEQHRINSLFQPFFTRLHNVS